MNIDLQKVDDVIEQYGKDEGSLIPVLLKTQELFNYLPVEATDRIAEKMGVSPLRIETIINFYKNFALDPRGQNIIKVCDGTACQANGGSLLVDHIERRLGITRGETTKDMLFTLEAVSCQGMCSLGPIMIVNGKTYANMTPAKLDKVLDSFDKNEVS